MNKKAHYNTIASQLVEAGFEVETDPDMEWVGVWGFTKPKGAKRRRKCFEEIYCTLIEVNEETTHSYWTTNKTYDAEDSDVEVLEHWGTPMGEDIIPHLSVQPIKRRKK